MIAHFSTKGLPILEVPISVNYDVPHKHKKHPLTHGVGVSPIDQPDRLSETVAFIRDNWCSIYHYGSFGRSFIVR